MAKASPIQDSFSTGEISPRLLARTKIERYQNSMALCQNYVPNVQGPVERRPGTIFVAEIKDSSKAARLVEFEFSITQAYIIEFGDSYIRFFRDYGQIVSGMSPYEIWSPYLEADLPGLRFAQSADVLFIIHPNYPPAILIRNDHDDWSLTSLRDPSLVASSATINEGPLGDLNTTTTTLTPGATSGLNVVITASSAAGINDGAGFKVSDVGRRIAIKNGANWGWGNISSFTSTTSVKADVRVDEAFSATSANVAWRLGVWGSALGWPTAITFHENRLILGGSASFPQTFWGSKVGDYFAFEPFDRDGTILSSSGYAFTVDSGDVNNIRWIKSDEKGMPIGTISGEFVARPNASGDSITPTNISVKRLSSWGSAAVDAIQLGKAVIFPQRTARKVRELTYFYEVDGFRAQDMTELATHILETGIAEMKPYKEPQPIVWARREDGLLLSMTYSREETVLAGWARHPMGGRSDVNGNGPIVESLAVIPSPDGSHYNVWMIVKRLIDGASVRYIEYIPAFMTDETLQEDSQFLDCALTYYDPKTIVSITLGANVVVTSTAHGFSNGNSVKFYFLIGANELLEETFVVSDATTDTFKLKDYGGTYIDGSLFTAYESEGEVRKVVSTISGLDHLEGESVSVFADGAIQADRTVIGGAISLQYGATKVHVGLNYISRGKCVRHDIGAADGTSLGKTRRTHNVSFYMHRSLNLKIGTDFDALDRVDFDETNGDLSQTPELFSGIYFNTIEADYDTENQICFEQDKPLPSTILAIMPQLLTQDR